MRRQIHCRMGQTILQAGQEQGLLTGGVCGGNGSCGKCRVRVLSPVCPPSAKDLRLLLPQELDEGIRLACTAVPDGDCLVSLPDEIVSPMAVVTEGGMIKGEMPGKRRQWVGGSVPAGSMALGGQRQEITPQEREVPRLAVVADIGTTTLAMQLVSYAGQDLRVVKTYTAENSQRAFGADVLSRIEASAGGRGEALRIAILRDLAAGIRKLMTMPVEGGERPLNRLIVAGNTTMIHLLMGYSCETLGRAPFRPVTTESIQMSAAELFVSTPDAAGLLGQAELFVFPGISAFVGGDIIAGLYVTGFYKSPEVQLLVDLGTNGEMVIGSRMRMLVASTAAGPAFEGGGISCGCAGIRGAVCGCSLLEDGTFQLRTIGGVQPVGICGSGIVEILYELLRAGRIDETGLIDGGAADRIELYQDRIYLTQQDIRAFQLAKAAVCAGILTIAQEYGAELSEIAHMYVAGGFGYSLNVEKAVAIGLFPAECKDRLVAVGNSSLAGCRAFLMEKDETKLSNIRRYAMERNLAQSDAFKEEYLRQMYFPLPPGGGSRSPD